VIDSAVLELFTLEEVLNRLSTKKSSGCLHLYTTRESANIFLKDGVAVAATNGVAEGPDVLKQVLTWQNVHYAWQPEAATSKTPSRPFHVPLRDILAHLHTNIDLGPDQKTFTAATTPDAVPVAAATSTPPPPIYRTIGAKGKTTAPIEVPELATPKATLSTHGEANEPEHLTATKSFSPAAQERTAEEEALLKKHRLALVSVDNPGKRLKITRISTLVGRNPACEIPIQHPSISRQHCLLQLSNRGLTFKDLRTTNGTKLNGVATPHGVVNVGDKLTFGHLNFVLEQEKE
jgi:hypothetical protein